jgi:hypothetical protein
MGRKAKLEAKVREATSKRKEERHANNRRAAWNRVGSRFGLSKQLIDGGKKSGLNPYRIFSDKSVTREQAQAFIQFGRCSAAQSYEYDWGDYAFDQEIARFEQDDDDTDFDFLN